MSKYELKLLTKEDLKMLKVPREVCIELVKEYARYYDSKTHYKILGPSVCNSVKSTIGSIINSTEYLGGSYLLADEIHPVKLAKFLNEFKGYNINTDILTYFVSNYLIRRINEMYRELKKGIYSIPLKSINKEELKEKYKERLDSGLKLIRSCQAKADYI